MIDGGGRDNGGYLRGGGREGGGYLGDGDDDDDDDDDDNNDDGRRQHQEGVCMCTGPSGCISCSGAVTSLNLMTWMCSRSSFSMMWRKSRLRQSRSPRMSPIGTHEESPRRGVGGNRGKGLLG